MSSERNIASHSEGKYFLGIDIGSSFTKLVLIAADGLVQQCKILPTLSRKKELFSEMYHEIESKYDISATCSTGYGRETIDSTIKKTELISVSMGVTYYFPHEKYILDIGGEDVKVVESSAGGTVQRFHMNDKCAAGTGSFITEIAAKAELEIDEMSELARASESSRVMNSFCTVFAKTEILGWKFNNVAIEEIAKGIYLSIVKRISKLPIENDRPIYLCGGVIAYHPYLADLLSDELKTEVVVTPLPQYIVALGAALLARKQHTRRTVQPSSGVTIQK